MGVITFLLFFFPKFIIKIKIFGVVVTRVFRKAHRRLFKIKIVNLLRHVSFMLALRVIKKIVKS